MRTSHKKLVGSQVGDPDAADKPVHQNIENWLFWRRIIVQNRKNKLKTLSLTNQARSLKFDSRICRQDLELQLCCLQVFYGMLTIASLQSIRRIRLCLPRPTGFNQLFENSMLPSLCFFESLSIFYWLYFTWFDYKLILRELLHLSLNEELKNLIKLKLWSNYLN